MLFRSAPQSLGHGDHPLPQGHRRNDVIGEMRRRLGHVTAVAGRADAAALAGECHDESLAACCAPAAGEAEAEEPGPSYRLDQVFQSGPATLSSYSWVIGECSFYRQSFVT